MKADRQQKKEENQQFISFDAFFISSKRVFYANHWNEGDDDGITIARNF